MVKLIQLAKLVDVIDDPTIALRGTIRVSIDNTGRRIPLIGDISLTSPQDGTISRITAVIQVPEHTVAQRFRIALNQPLGLPGTVILDAVGFQADAFITDLNPDCRLIRVSIVIIIRFPVWEVVRIIVL
ncbi:MAG: hypothetical protein SWN10_22350 [Pseudomonadota bacterium]|nr:hypothetical protein [Pseudomonadota bacterium]